MMEQNSGNLDLCNTDITNLPDGLAVQGYLNLSGTNIRELPENLTIRGKSTEDYGETQ